MASVTNPRQEAQEAPRPHHKTRMVVFVGIRDDGRECGHQHVSEDRAKNCLMGQRQTIALMEGRARVERLTPRQREARA